ncbi:defensin Ec-AMP-D2-like [Chenopodium quinoa]|uniref:defensin Ec-AMP-D2-like n=1 Tax=Chenopodium quinoa TaxID=63459 RepID=UPI000B76E794|nr:defensin Ec-AMP-D2-like [Chenopodium quinoa]
MARLIRVFSALILVMLMFTVTELGPNVAEARTCETKSHRFKGLCGRKANCAAICQGEGFQGGHCRGFRRRCFCTKHC